MIAGALNSAFIAAPLPLAKPFSNACVMARSDAAHEGPADVAICHTHRHRHRHIETQTQTHRQTETETQTQTTIRVKMHDDAATCVCVTTRCTAHLHVERVEVLDRVDDAGARQRADGQIRVLCQRRGHSDTTTGCKSDREAMESRSQAA
jgi:hypothetical protein